MVAIGFHSLSLATVLCDQQCRMLCTNLLIFMISDGTAVMVGTPWVNMTPYFNTLEYDKQIK